MVRRSALPTLWKAGRCFFRLWILCLRLREFFVGFCEWLSARCCGMTSLPGNAQKRGENDNGKRKRKGTSDGPCKGCTAPA